MKKSPILGLCPSYSPPPNPLVALKKVYFSIVTVTPLTPRLNCKP